MSDYIIIKNKEGIVVAYGPNNGHYEHTLQDGQTSEIVTEKIANVLIDAMHARLDAEQQAITKVKNADHDAALAKLAALGLTTDDLRALGL